MADAVTRLGRAADPVSGGFGRAPKFPAAMVLEFLLRHHGRTGSPEALGLVEEACTAMARGGIYDQLAGGFARYAAVSYTHLDVYKRQVRLLALESARVTPWLTALWPTLSPLPVRCSGEAARTPGRPSAPSRVSKTSG